MKKHLFLLLTPVCLAVLAACGQDTLPVAVTVAEICQQESGTNITAVGYLSLPGALICEAGQCKINFYDDTGSVLTEFVVTDKPASGKLQLPPDRYTSEDLHFVLKDGTPGDQTTNVKITGPVRRPSANSCYLEAYHTEKP